MSASARASRPERRETLAAGVRAALAAVLLLASAPPSSAATWYTVEVIGFEHLDDSALSTEHWPSDPGAPDTDRAVALAGGGSGGFRLLGSGSLRLREVASLLARSSRYRPVLHLAWRQPGFTRSEAREVYISSALPNPFRERGTRPAMNGADGTASGLLGLAGTRSDRAVLEGTLRLHRARYLHLEADMLHYRPRASAAEATAASVFRLRESRRMRSGELHYFDHPLFGLLVVVIPYRVPEPESTVE